MKSEPRRPPAPLAGWRVLVTGTRPEPIVNLLEARGARPVAISAIAVRAVDDPAIDRALAEAWDWIVVTSESGVRALVERRAARGRAAPEGARWAAVGPRTAEALRAAGVEPAAVPAAGRGAAIPDAMGEVAGRRVLLARARGAGDDLPGILRARGAEVADVAVYETVEGPEASRAPLAAALAAGVDAVVLTSGSTARGLARLAGGVAPFARARIVAIGPTTAAAARAAGFAVAVTAAAPTPAELVAALERAAGGLDPTAGADELGRTP